MDLAEHSCFTNWGNYKSIWITTNQIKSNVSFGWEEKTGVPTKKPLRAEKQQTQPTYGGRSGNRTQATLMENKSSHHYANPGFSDQYDD